MFYFSQKIIVILSLVDLTVTVQTDFVDLLVIENCVISKYRIRYTGNYPERFEISLYFTSIFNINMLAAKIPHRIFEDDFALYYDC